MRRKRHPECSLNYYCDRRKGNYCCTTCGYSPGCKRKCLNSPERCGSYIAEPGAADSKIGENGGKPENKED